MSVCFLNFIPRSHIYRDMAVAAFSSGLQGWMFGSLGWSSGPAKLVGWPLQLKSGTAADFACKLFLKNKTQRQSHITFGYFLVQYHFAPHPPNKQINFKLIFKNENAIVYWTKNNTNQCNPWILADIRGFSYSLCFLDFPYKIINFYF